jgi:hypothetical protein
MPDGLPQFLMFDRRKRGTTKRPTPGEAPGDTPPAPAPQPAVKAAPPVIDPAAAVVEPPPPAAVGVTEAGVPVPAAPEVTGAQRRAMGPAPLQRNAKGETVGRPQYDDTGDRSADLANYDRQLESERNPKDRDGRWWTTLKEAGRGFLEGGLMGAAARGLRGAFSPNVNERRDRDRERARVAGEMGKERERQGWQAKLHETQADIDLKNANAEYARKRPEIETERNDLRETIARDGNETRKAIAGMNDATRRSEGDANRSTRKEISGADRELRERIASNNLKFRKEESEANRRQRQEQFAGRMKLGWANYGQRIEEAKQRAAQAAAADRARGINTAVSYAKAKAQAEAKGFDLPDYIDILTEAGIEVK